MFNIQQYPEAVQEDLRDIATGALAAAGIARVMEVPAVEQLNDHPGSDIVAMAREQMMYRIIHGLPEEQNDMPTIFSKRRLRAQ